MTKRPICVNLEKSLIIKIDQSRGEVPRSRVVEQALNDKFCKLEPQEKDLGVVP